MKLDDFSKQLCTTCLPWGMYVCDCLPMGVKLGLDIFAEMGALFADMENVVVYIDDVVIFSSEDFKDHLRTVKEVLRRPEDAGIQVNPLKSFWTQDEVDYLGFLPGLE